MPLKKLLSCLALVCLANHAWAGNSTAGVAYAFPFMTFAGLIIVVWFFSYVTVDEINKWRSKRQKKGLSNLLKVLITCFYIIVFSPFIKLGIMIFKLAFFGANNK